MTCETTLSTDNLFAFVRLCAGGKIKNFHLFSLPVFPQHISKNLEDTLDTILDSMCEERKKS